MSHTIQDLFALELGRDGGGQVIEGAVKFRAPTPPRGRVAKQIEESGQSVVEAAADVVDTAGKARPSSRPTFPGGSASHLIVKAELTNILPKTFSPKGGGHQRGRGSRHRDPQAIEDAGNDGVTTWTARPISRNASCRCNGAENVSVADTSSRRPALGAGSGASSATSPS